MQRNAPQQRSGGGVRALRTGGEQAQQCGCGLVAGESARHEAALADSFKGNDIDRARLPRQGGCQSEMGSVAAGERRAEGGIDGVGDGSGGYPGLRQSGGGEIDGDRARAVAGQPHAPQGTQIRPAGKIGGPGEAGGGGGGAPGESGCDAENGGKRVAGWRGQEMDAARGPDPVPGKGNEPTILRGDRQADGGIDRGGDLAGQCLGGYRPGAVHHHRRERVDREGEVRMGAQIHPGA